MKDKRLLFVSGAYTGDVEKNIAKAEEVSIGLIRAGFHVITPHKNIAGYEKYEDGTLNKRTWMDMCFNILKRCDAIYVMDNWKDSEGAKEEIAYAHRHGIPVIYEEGFPIDRLQEFWRIQQIFNGDGK